MRTIIGIAAPARSGKDTVAAMLLQHPGVCAYALADPLKNGCQTLFGLTDAETWDSTIKEQTIALWGRSPREFFQYVGTDWMRTHNPDHWLIRAERVINSPAKNDCPAFTQQLQDINAIFQITAQAFFGLSFDQTWNVDFFNAIDPIWGMNPQQMFGLIESLTLKEYPDYIERRLQRPLAPPTRELPTLGESQVIIIKDIRFENEADFLRRHNGTIWHIVRENAQKVNPHASEMGIKIKDKDVVIDNNGTLDQLAIAVENAWQSQMQRILISKA